MVQWLRFCLPTQGPRFKPWPREIPHARAAQPQAVMTEAWAMRAWCSQKQLIKHLKREMVKKKKKKNKEIHSYARIQMNNSPKNKDLGMCAKPPWARLLTSGLPFVPKHVSSRCPQSCYLWHFSLFIYLFFSIPSCFLSNFHPVRRSVLPLYHLSLSLLSLCLP